MQKQLIALIIAASSFASSYLMSFSPKPAFEGQTVQKDLHHDFHPILKDHGKLYFQFMAPQFQAHSPNNNQNAPAEDEGDLIGEWQAMVITPDKRTFKSPVFNAVSSPETFIIQVKPPILYGTYTVCVTNMSVTNADGSTFQGSFIDPTITVLNSFNKKISIFYMQSAEDQQEQNNNTLSTIQGFFVPPTTFIKKEGKL